MNTSCKVAWKTAFCAVWITVFSSCMPSADYIIKHPNFTWVKDSSNRFYYLMEKSIWTKERMDSIKLAMEGNFAFVMQKLQNDFFPFDRMHHFIVQHPDSIKTLLNQRAADPLDEYLFHKDTLGIQSFSPRYLITTFGQKSLYSRERDLLSIIIINTIWGSDCPSYLNHSIGIYVNDSWKGYDLHDLAAYFYKNSYRYEQFFYLNLLVKPTVEYPMIASLLKYAVEKHGILFVRQRCHDWNINWLPLQNQIFSEWEEMLKNRYSKPSPIDTIRYLQYFN